MTGVGIETTELQPAAPARRVLGGRVRRELTSPRGVVHRSAGGGSPAAAIRSSLRPTVSRTGDVRAVASDVCAPWTRSSPKQTQSEELHADEHEEHREEE